MSQPLVDAQVTPSGRLGILSKSEMHQLLDRSRGGVYSLFRNCALAVLNAGNVSDDAKELFETYRDFDIQVVSEERGIKLDVKRAPASAFVDGKMIQGQADHLFSVLRDVVFVNDEILGNPRFDLETSPGITDAVFHILRNAGVLQATTNPRLVVCWGGHSISRNEYDYTKEVGYRLGLRGLDICTGCGPGAMKGPMKGAAVGHAKQRLAEGRYLGLTEPGIIAAESPNAIVNELVILPDIEKRLEAFVRTGHGIVVFPGGAGTAEEIFYLLGILLNPDNADLPFPLVLTGPAGSHEYFEQIDQFLLSTLGEAARSRYQIVVDDPIRVAHLMQEGIESVKAHRRKHDDAYFFNWLLRIDAAFQEPFVPSHDNMKNLVLDPGLPAHVLASNLRRVFSGIVAGNVKEEGLRAIEKHGPFQIDGDKQLMASMDTLLRSFVEQGRMKLPGTTYVPCYEVLS